MSDTAEKIKVMQAFLEYKDVWYYEKQDLSSALQMNKNWEPIWNWEVYDYYIKEKPESVPFDESDAEFLIGKAIKIRQDVFLIVRINKHGAVVIDEDNCFIGFIYLLQNYTFLDGTPCGKLK